MAAGNHENTAEYLENITFNVLTNKRKYIKIGLRTLMQHYKGEIALHPKQIQFIIKSMLESVLYFEEKSMEAYNDLPEDIRPKSGYGNTYAKLWWERPSTTITRNFACPSSSRCIHPRDSRAMSIREGARLQSFPDDYKFYGSDGMKRLEIGNAVPPLLSIAIAKQMIKALKEQDATE